MWRGDGGIFRGLLDWKEAEKLSFSKKLPYNEMRISRHGYRESELKSNQPTIQAFYNKHDGMARSSIHQMSVILHQVFDLAVEDGHMKFNPTESKRLFMKGSKQKREALRDCDVKEIMDKLFLLEAKDRIPLAILLYTGVRRGEALGLRWENLDWKKGVIHIEQAVTFLNNQPVLGKTKSDAGIRQRDHPQDQTHHQSRS